MAASTASPPALRNYLIGLVLAAGLTVASFWVASGTSLIYTPGVPMALAALAVAQMGVHLAFFLHITTGPDNTNNALALAFGALIVGIVIAGSLWIMYHLNANMMAAGRDDGHAHAALTGRPVSRAGCVPSWPPSPASIRHAPRSCGSSRRTGPAGSRAGR